MDEKYYPFIAGAFAFLQGVAIWIGKLWWGKQRAEIETKIRDAVMNSQGIIEPDMTTMREDLKILQEQRKEEDRRFFSLESKMDTLSRDVHDMTKAILEALTK